MTGRVAYGRFDHPPWFVLRDAAGQEVARFNDKLPGLAGRVEDWSRQNPSWTLAGFEIRNGRVEPKEDDAH